MRVAAIQRAAPRKNFGTRTTWGVDANGVKDSMVKFAVTGLNGRPVVGARLRLRCTDSSNLGGRFFAAGGAWSESSVTWNSAPAATGDVLASLGGVVSGSDYLVDLTGRVTGEGVYSLRASSTSSDGALFASSEVANAGLRPVLELTLGPVP